MRIGLVIYGSLDTLTGGYLYDRRLVSHLNARGDEVRLISLPWRSYLRHLTDNLHFRLPAGLDLLIQDELNHPSLLAANASPHPCPVVSLVHHLRSSELRPAWQNRFYRFIERRYLHSVDAFIFNSKTTAGIVCSVVGDDKPALTAPPPTDRFAAALPEKAVRERSRQGGPLRLVFVGSLIPRKGLHTLLHALALLNNTQPVSAHLDVVGSLATDPAYVRRIRRLVGDLRLQGQVTLHGALDEAPLVEKLSQAQVLVVPSTYEGYGMVYLEGMTFGLPAIGTQTGAAGEVICDGETGYLVPAQDASALAVRLAALGLNRDLLARLSLNALRQSRLQPPWEHTGDRIRQFLLELTTGQR